MNISDLLGAGGFHSSSCLVPSRSPPLQPKSSIVAYYMTKLSTANTTHTRLRSGFSVVRVPGFQPQVSYPPFIDIAGQYSPPSRPLFATVPYRRRLLCAPAMSHSFILFHLISFLCTSLQDLLDFRTLFTSPTSSIQLALRAMRASTLKHQVRSN